MTIRDMMTDRRDRLPKWAQAELERLEKSIEWWKVKATAGPGNSNTFVEHLYGEDRQPLGTDPIIAFEADGDRWEGRFHVRLDDGVLDVSGPGFVIEPLGSNHVRIRHAR